MNRKEIEGKIKLKRGRLYQINSKTKGGVTRISSRDSNSGFYQAVRTDGIQPGIKLFNTSASENQVVRYTPATQSIAGLDWHNYQPEQASQSTAEIIKPVVVYSNSKLEESAVSIVYRVTEPNTPTECTCPTWNRVGNRCIQVCDATGTYASLEQCLTAPSPPWPPPGGQDGRGGYWVVYAGHKQSTGYVGNGYSYSTGSWAGGLFYQFSDAFNNCSSTDLQHLDHRVPKTYVLASPGDFPNYQSSDSFWFYFSLPMMPFVNLSVYPLGKIAFMKNAITTTGVRQCDTNGWFAWADYNVDVFLQGSGTWHSGDPGVAYAICFVAKYVPAGSFSGGNGTPPSPPATIEGFNVSGVTLLHNRGSFQCGGGGSTPAEEPPENKNAYKYYLGGSKPSPVLLHQVNITDPHSFYVVATDLKKNEDNTISTKEIVNFLLGRNSDNSYCKVLSVQVDGQTVTKASYNKPSLPQQNPKDWRYSLLDYIPPPDPSTDSVINTYRTLSYYNLIQNSKESIYHLFYFDLEQFIEGAYFSTLIRTSNVDGKASLQYSLKEGNTTTGKTIVVPKIYSLNNSNAQVLAVAPYVKVKTEYFLAGSAIDQEPVSLGEYTEGDHQWTLSAVGKRFISTIKSVLNQSTFGKIDQFNITPKLDVSSESFTPPNLPESLESNPENIFTQTYSYPLPDPDTPCLKELVLKPFKNLLTASKLVVVDPEQMVEDEEENNLGKLVEALRILPRDRFVKITFNLHTLTEDGNTCTIGEGQEKKTKLFGLGIENDNDILQFLRVRDVVIAKWTQKK